MIEIRSVERPEHTEYYLTAPAPAAGGDLAAAREIYAKIAAFLAEKRIEPIIEKAFGRVARKADIAAVRADAFVKAGLSPALPFAFLECAPVHDGAFAGMQIWGVAPKGQGARGKEQEGGSQESEVRSQKSQAGSRGAACCAQEQGAGNLAIGDGLVRTEILPSGAVGRRVDFDGCRMLFVPGITGLAAGNQASAPTAQAAAMFDRARDAAAAAGFTYREVIRTWIYLARILDWYGDFNGVRTAFFRREGIGADQSGRDFPASTGIQGRTGDEACVMDLLALQADPSAGVKIEPIFESARQDSPFKYGSAFSRAMAVRRGGVSTIYVSGTASVNRAGKVAHVGDPGAQAVETLLCIAALLDDQGGGLQNIVQATCYVKNAAIWDAYREAARLLRLPRFPLVPVIADICRDEWLIEIEAVALI